jgi:hypothetical protein
MPNIDKDVLKEATKEAIKEWLDEQFIKLGKWTLGGLLSASVAAIGWLILTSQGWHK